MHEQTEIRAPGRLVPYCVKMASLIKSADGNRLIDAEVPADGVHVRQTMEEVAA